MTFLAFVHIALAILLIVLVLLQDSKGGALGAFGGGSSNSVFGSTGGSQFLSQSTKWLAIFFSATCIALAYMTTHVEESVLDKHIPKTQGTATTEEPLAPQTEPQEKVPTKETPSQ